MAKLIEEHLSCVIPEQEDSLSKSIRKVNRVDAGNSDDGQELEALARNSLSNSNYQSTPRLSSEHRVLFTQFILWTSDCLAVKKGVGLI